MKRLLVLLAFLAFGCTSARVRGSGYSASAKTFENGVVDRVDQFVRAEMQREKVPGVAIAITK